MTTTLDPFGYFLDHASAIDGFGGEHLSPDPRYCFHTPYVAVRQGQAGFELQLHGVRASRGELALRVHAYRPDSGENASLVAAARLDVASRDSTDLTASVRFAALRGVIYAFYGFFIEDSDLHATGLKIVLHEAEGDDADEIEPPRSILAQAQGDREVRPANALIHMVTPRLHVPVSQDCTLAQLDDMHAPFGDAPFTDWAEALCFAALEAYDARTRALEALLVGDASAAFVAALAETGFLIRQLDSRAVPQANSAEFGDIVLWPQGLWPETDPAARWHVVRSWFGRLKIGGLGVVVVRYRPEAAVSVVQATDGPDITRNEIGKWALRLIADGYSVAPLAFSDPDCLLLDDAGLVRFALIVRRQ